MKVAPVVPKQETSMEPQLKLFETEEVTRGWVERVWRGVSAEQREAVLSVLATLVHKRLASRSSTPTKRDADDET